MIESTPDKRPPNEARIMELRAAYDANVSAGRPPYWHVHIHMLEEVLWIMRERGWKSMDNFRLSEQASNDIYETTADFRGVNFSRAQLAGVKLVGAQLDNALLIQTNLRDALLIDAVLSDVRMRYADCTGARFSYAKLERAHCRGANMSNVDLSFATLYGARLAQCDLRGSQLVGVHCDASTVFSESIVDEQTQFADVIWNDALLTRIDWSHVGRIGDEAIHLRSASNRTARIAALRTAGRAYNGLGNALKNQGMMAPAARFRMRSQQLERRATRLERKPFSWIGSLLLDIVAGYGERPGRAFVVYLLVILGFAAAYYTVGQIAGPAFSPVGSLIFSLTSFHGRGFFPATITSIDSSFTILASVEAVVGLFIELMFIATFSRRFLGE